MEFHSVFRIRREKPLVSLHEIALPVTTLARTGVWRFRGFWIDCEKWDEFESRRSAEFVVDDYDVVTIFSVDAAEELFRIASLDWGAVRFAPEEGAEPTFIASCVDGAFWVVATASDDISAAMRSLFTAEISEALADDMEFLSIPSLCPERSDQ
ncbi:MAG: hypothetical protein JNN30_15215 [Rhodanobacteraceae bacterium]|nr:hypothetical protein [Rhodanobacteraceae bacterium]